MTSGFKIQTNDGKIKEGEVSKNLLCLWVEISGSI